MRHPSPNPASMAASEMRGSQTEMRMALVVGGSVMVASRSRRITLRTWTWLSPGVTVSPTTVAPALTRSKNSARTRNCSTFLPMLTATVAKVGVGEIRLAPTSWPWRGDREGDGHHCHPHHQDHQPKEEILLAELDQKAEDPGGDHDEPAQQGQQRQPDHGAGGQALHQPAAAHDLLPARWLSPLTHGASLLALEPSLAAPEFAATWVTHGRVRIAFGLESVPGSLPRIR